MENEKSAQGGLLGRIRAVGRLPVARAVGMPYGTLSAKLNGYVAMTDEERGKIEVAVAALEQNVNIPQ